MTDMAAFIMVEVKQGNTTGRRPTPSAGTNPFCATCCGIVMPIMRNIIIEKVTKGRGCLCLKYPLRERSLV